jgi:uncharacterized protein HemY
VRAEHRLPPRPRLLDHAEHLTRLGDHATAETAISEAYDIAQRLRCQPLLAPGRRPDAQRPR